MQISAEGKASRDRNTNPHKPGGNVASNGIGSGNRRSSVKTHSVGNAAPGRQRLRDLTARAHATSFASMPPSPELTSQTIAASLASVRSRIAAATVRSGREPGAVTLVAVSKTYPMAAVEQALSAGQLQFGENRVQEAAAKFAELRPRHPGVRLHIIGPLQTNKALAAVQVADVIETLDRPKLADAIAVAADRADRMPLLLIQVNVGNEPQKAGVAPDAADAFIASCQLRFGAALVGLMCIPPADADPAPHFTWLAARAHAHGLAIVSMGMSGDYETAIAHGATHVRVGSAIFGSRPPAAA